MCPFRWLMLFFTLLIGGLYAFRPLKKDDPDEPDVDVIASAIIPAAHIKSTETQLNSIW